MKKLACILALGSAFASFNAMAWGTDGHRAVGAIADQLIKGSNAGAQVAALLQPGESLERISTWADCVKGTYCGPQSVEMTAYTAFHAYWDTTVVDYAMRRIGARTPQQFAQLAIAAKPAVAANTGALATWPYQWADDALAVSKLAHAEVTVGAASKQASRSGAESYTVWALSTPDGYPVASLALAKDQLIKGGHHLAALLQKIWP